MQKVCSVEKGFIDANSNGNKLSGGVHVEMEIDNHIVKRKFHKVTDVSAELLSLTIKATIKVLRGGSVFSIYTF